MPPSHPEIFDRVKDILVKGFGVDPTEVQENTPILDLGSGLDSTDLLDLIFRLEKEFKVVIGDPPGEYGAPDFAKEVAAAMPANEDTEQPDAIPMSSHESKREIEGHVLVSELTTEVVSKHRFALPETENALRSVAVKDLVEFIRVKLEEQTK